MNLPLAKLTSKKFYNKWMYKVTLNVNGGHLLKYNSLDSIATLCESGKRSDKRWGWNVNSAFADRTAMLKLSVFLLSKDKDSWTKRIEKTFVDFYTNDVGFYKEICALMPERIIHRFEPENKAQDILADSVNNIAVKKLPHNRYRHKVYLLPHKIKYDKESKRKFLDWLLSQVPKVTCSHSIEKWFLETDWNWDRRYILVEDEATLLMMKLKNPEVVGRVHNYILYDK